MPQVENQNGISRRAFLKGSSLAGSVAPMPGGLAAPGKIGRHQEKA